MKDIEENIKEFENVIECETEHKSYTVNTTPAKFKRSDDDIYGKFTITDNSNLSYMKDIKFYYDTITDKIDLRDFLGYPLGKNEEFLLNNVQLDTFIKNAVSEYQKKWLWMVETYDGTIIGAYNTVEEAIDSANAEWAAGYEAIRNEGDEIDPMTADENWIFIRNNYGSDYDYGYVTTGGEVKEYENKNAIIKRLNADFPPTKKKSLADVKQAVAEKKASTETEHTDEKSKNNGR